MAKFKFKLETVLNQRKAREDQALAGFATAQKALQSAKEHKAALGVNLQDALFRREGLGQVATQVSVFHTEQDFIVGTKQRIIQAEHGILRAQRGVEKAMRVYLLARRQSRAIEILKEKAFEEFKRERAKLEQKSLDDLMIMRHRFSEGASDEI